MSYLLMSNYDIINPHIYFYFLCFKSFFIGMFIFYNRLLDSRNAVSKLSKQSLKQVWQYQPTYVLQLFYVFQISLLRCSFSIIDSWLLGMVNLTYWSPSLYDHTNGINFIINTLNIPSVIWKYNIILKDFTFYWCYDITDVRNDISRNNKVEQDLS